MIKIVTKDGISLDLAPDAEFVVEYNNPMMEDGRIPVPFSTSIALIPSATNCKVLQYLPALKLEPAVKKLAASIVFNGIPFLTGTLIYDGIEDGNINYTFAGKDLEDEWGMKLYKMEIGEFSSISGEHSGFFFPPVVLKDYTGYFVQEKDDISFTVGRDNNYPKVEWDVKYANYPEMPDFSDTNYLRRVPAIGVKMIIGDRLTFSTDIAALVQYIYVLAQYDIQGWIVTKVYVPHYASDHLPDITLVEFIQNLAHMFCSAVFEDGGKFVMKSFDTVISESSSIDWTKLVADKFDSEVDSGAGYSFGYANAVDEPFDDARLVDTPNSKSALYPYKVSVNKYKRESFSRSVRIASSGDCVSVYVRIIGATSVSGLGEHEKVHTIVCANDVIFHNNLKQQNIIENRDTTENSCSFNLVKCVPSVLTQHSGYQYLNTDQRYVFKLWQKFCMVPIVELGNEDASRGTDVYIGLSSKKTQLTDNGQIVEERPSDYPTDAEMEAMNDYSVTLPAGSRLAGKSLSLKPDWIYSNFHKRYAQWLATDRQVITCDVNLNEFDLLNFRMYNKVRLHGRDFFVKKLSVTLRAGSEALECSADFISA